LHMEHIAIIKDHLSIKLIIIMKKYVINKHKKYH